ncbi:MAG: threonine synthase [Muribaculaceae bacterium]|nr:threonine synthase [Muribaculaceae bacterium]
MRYYNTNNRSETVTLEEAIFKGMATDGGLYMPERIVRMPQAFVNNMKSMTLPEIGFALANFALQGDVEPDVLHDIVYDTLNFPIPLRHVADRHYALELFHGPTMAFKDVGARFMARLMAYFNSRRPGRHVSVIVPTSGDTGSAVANGFAHVPGVHVYVLYPCNKVSNVQEAQFAAIGGNVTAIEVNGTFDECKQLAEQAFLDRDLNRRLTLTSATTINVARLLPQTFYYFWAYAQLLQQGHDGNGLVMAVPCANLGNLASGLMARAMGLPVKRFISVENDNNIFYNYVVTGQFTPRPSVTSIAPALDAGNPTNFARITALLGDVEHVRKAVHALSYSDADILDTIARVHREHGYLLDPQSAIAWRGMEVDLQPGETGITLATAHPAKFSAPVEAAIGQPVPMPLQLVRFMQGTRHVTPLKNGYTSLRKFLLENAS